MLATLACLVLTAADTSGVRDLHAPPASPFERFEQSRREDAPSFSMRPSGARVMPPWDWREPLAFDLPFPMDLERSTDASPWSLSEVSFELGASPAGEEPSIDGLSPSFDEVMRLYRTPPFETRFVLRYSPGACE